MDVLYAVSSGLGILKVLFDVHHVCLDLYHGDTGQFYIRAKKDVLLYMPVIVHKVSYPCLMNHGTTNLTFVAKGLITTRRGIHCEKSEERKNMISIMTCSQA